MKSLLRFFAFLFCLFSSPLLFGMDASPSTATLPEMTRNSTLVLTAIIEKIEPWKQRPDWIVLTLKGHSILKGKIGDKGLKVFYQNIFLQKELPFKKGEMALFFLNDLPPYTSWEEMLKSGIRYQPLQGQEGIFKSPEDQKVIADFVLLWTQKESEKLSPQGWSSFYSDQLRLTTLPRLQKDLAIEYLSFLQKNPSLVDKTVLGDLSEKMNSSYFSSEGKIKIMEGLVRFKPAPLLNDTIRQFFCIQPEAVCLLTAEALESRKAAISVADYSKTLEKGYPTLNVGLLNILGRHQRRDSYPLFEKELQKQKNEKVASDIIKALGKLGGTEAESLCMRYGRDTRYEVRGAVVECLGNLRSVKAIGLLEENLKSGDPLLITLAINSLQKVGTKEALETLAKYYEKTPHGPWEPAAHESLPMK